MKKILVIVLLSLLVGSCEEWTPEYRIINSWKLNKACLNGQEIAADSTSVHANRSGAFYTFFSDPVMEVTVLINGTTKDSYRGNYSLGKKGKKLYVDFLLAGRAYKYTADIKKLTKDELKYEYKDEGGDLWRLEFYSYY
ncbi:MAG: hypothetical protein LBK03_07060 [Bacteroidales bacterium]|jgi:hypothetical protein|nr:hypothetical protein [Bacteroidales bacterium]